MLFKNRGSRELLTKLDILTEKGVKIGSFEGVVISGSVDLDADSTYRRNARLSAILLKELLPMPENKIWFNKRVEVSVGLKDWGDEVYWYSLGRYAIDKADFNRGQEEEKSEFSLLDYMAFLDGTLGGSLTNETTMGVESGVTVAQAIRASVQGLSPLFIENLQIEGLDARLPFDMEFSPTDTVYKIVSDLTELFMSQEFFFDEKGVFRVQNIRDRIGDPIMWDFTVDSMDLAIDYTNQMDFSNVKNSIHVWGMTDDNTGEQVWWIYRNKFSRNSITDMNGISSKEKGDICYVKNENKSYVWDTTWKPLDFNVEPKFNIESIGEKVLTLSEDNIQTLDQAKLKAEYELKQYSTMAEIVSFTCLPIYLLSANDKIKLEDKKTGIKGDYLIKSLSTPLEYDGVMSVTASKIYY